MHRSSLLESIMHDVEVQRGTCIQSVSTKLNSKIYYSHALLGMFKLTIAIYNIYTCLKHYLTVMIQNILFLGEVNLQGII